MIHTSMKNGMNFGVRSVTIDSRARPLYFLLDWQEPHRQKQDVHRKHSHVIQSPKYQETGMPKSIINSRLNIRWRNICTDTVSCLLVGKGEFECQTQKTVEKLFQPSYNLVNVPVRVGEKQCALKPRSRTQTRTRNAELSRTALIGFCRVARPLVHQQPSSSRRSAY